MIPTISLFMLAEQKGICVEYVTLPAGFVGLYTWDPVLKYPHIGLDKSLLKNDRLNRCVLAHELGHCEKSVGNALSAASTTVLYRLSREEKLATDWAVELLVPSVRFLRLLVKQYTFEEMTDYFYVIPEFIVHKARRLYENGLRIPEVRRLIHNSEFRIAT